jgi:VCBS repeat-containing protein
LLQTTPAVTILSFPATIDEGSPASGNGSFIDPDGGTWTATVDYIGDDSNVQSLALDLDNKTFDLSHIYSNEGSYTVFVSVSDGIDGLIDDDSVGITVNNVAPIVDAGSDATINQGGTFSSSGSFADPGDDPWSGTVNYDDGNGDQPLTLVGKTFELSHLYPEDGTYTVTVTIDDGTTTANDLVEVTVTNSAPIVDAGEDDTIDEGGTFSSSGSFTDLDEDSWTGTVNYGDGSGDETLTLTPEKTFALSHLYPQDGIYTVTVTIDDGTTPVDDTVQVTVNNLAPSAGPDSIEVTEDGVATTLAGGSVTSLLANDTDPGTSDILTLTTIPVSGPTNGSLTLNSNGTFSYDHNGGETTTDSFTYQVCDNGLPPLCANGLASISITPVNDPPTIEDIPTKTTNEDTSTGPIGFIIGDAETPAANLIVTASSSNLTLVPIANIVHGGGGASRTITINPASNQNGSTVITVTVTDANDVSTSDTFTLNVTAVNDAPTITNITNRFIEEDTETDPINFTVGDVETPAGSLLVTASSSNTTLVPNTNIDHGGTAGSRNVTITPADNQNGTTDITITVNDLTGGIASETFTLTVDPAEDPPEITEGASTTVEMDEDGITKAFELTLNATDPDGDFLTWTISEPADHGTASAFGIGASKEIGYTPDTNYNGTDSFEVEVSDGTGNSDFIAVNVNIAPVNDVPTGLSDPYEVNYGTTLTVPAPGVLGNDGDPDGDAITAVNPTDPSHGTLDLNPDGSFSYTPTGSFIGEDSFTYQVKDTADETSPAIQVVINVKDASSPSLVWIEPVGDGGQLDVFGEVIVLKVNATDDVSVDYVKFYRWDPNVQPSGAFIDIGIDEDPPFEIPINTSILNYEFNEIRARAFDNTGKFSSQKWIWLFRVPPTNYLYIPLAAGE